jgi:parallel beta-helix repeat protein
MKRLVSGIVLMLLLMAMFSLAFNIKPAKAEPRIIVVPDDYSTIQEAINAASYGDTIFVKEGTYYENVVVNKPILLIGQNAANTIVDAGGKQNVITVNANNIVIVNLTLRNSGKGGGYPAFPSGVFIENAGNCTIKDNIITDNLMGIYIVKSSDIVISGNNITSNLSDGIELVLESFNVTISENTINNNRGYAIGIFDSSFANKIIQNNITSNGPIMLSDNSFNNSVIGNIMKETGLSLWGYTHDNTIIGNNFINSGLSAAYTYKNVVKDNLVNGKPLIYLEGESNLTIVDSEKKVGQIILVSCNGMLVEDLTIFNANIGIQLYNVTNSKIINCSISTNLYPSCELNFMLLLTIQ